VLIKVLHLIHHLFTTKLKKKRNKGNDYEVTCFDGHESGKLDVGKSVGSGGIVIFEDYNEINVNHEITLSVGPETIK